MCVQVLHSKLDNYVKRVMNEFMESKTYKRLNSERQREAHGAVLKYILEQNNEIRRRDLKNIFVVGGTNRNRDFLRDPLTNNDLSRILTRLKNAEFIQRKEKNGKVFFRSHFCQILFCDIEDGGTSEQLLNDVLIDLVNLLEDPHKLALIIRHELEDAFRNNISDEEFEQYLMTIGYRYGRTQNRCIRYWANNLPIEHNKLRNRIILYLDTKID